MGRLLRDEDGRELLLAEGFVLEADILMVEGEPLVRLDNPARLSPLLMDSIAASVPGSSIRRPRLRTRATQRDMNGSGSPTD